MNRAQVTAVTLLTLTLTLALALIGGCSKASSESTGSDDQESSPRSVSNNRKQAPLASTEVSDVLSAHMRGEADALDRLVIGDREAALEMVSWLRIMNSILEEDEIALATSGAGAEARKDLAARTKRRDAAREKINAQWSEYFNIRQTGLAGKWFLDRKAMEQQIIEETAAKYPDNEGSRERVTQSLLRGLETDYTRLQLNGDGTFESNEIFGQYSGWFGDGYWEPTDTGVALHPLTRRPGTASYSNDRPYQVASEGDHLVWAGKSLIRGG